MIEKSILKLYQPADTEIIINDNDADLTPIHVPLPKPPPLEFIEGYGKHPSEQKWTRPRVPESIIKIQRDSNTIQEAWEKLDMKRREMPSDIEWLRRMWFYRLNGCWQFINGKPTYIPPSHFMLLSFLKLNTGTPEYRDRGRKVHMVFKWLSEYTYDFKDKRLNDRGERIANKPGDELIDLGERTMLGAILPKGRRLAESTNALAWMLNRSTLQIRGKNGIQGYDEKSSSEPYKEFVRVFRTLPFFFLPSFNKDAESSLKFVNNSGNIFDDQGLQTTVEPASTGHSGYFDGREITDYWLDEAGKKVSEPLGIAWETCRNFLSWGGGKVIRGFAILPSNSGEYKKGGGKEYLDLIKDSNYYERTMEGRTRSGLITLFIPSDEGSQGHIDKFGNSLKEKCHQYYISERQHLLGLKTQESTAKYMKLCREHPLSLAECFIYDQTGVGFNQLILSKRIGELTISGKKVTIKGNFKWTQGLGSDVMFEEDPFGRWVLSKQLPEGLANRKVYKNGVWCPMFPTSYMHGADPFNYAQTKGTKQSDGAGITIERKMYSQKDSSDVTTWTTPDIVCTYLSRPATPELFAEDMLMQTLYWGGLMNPECNYEIVRSSFIKWGFAGFLYYYRGDDGVYSKTAGIVKTTNVGDRIIGAASRFIELHGFRCNHLEVLEVCKKFRGVEDITNLDLLACFGEACDAIENDYRNDQVVSRNAIITVNDMFSMKKF